MLNRLTNLTVHAVCIWFTGTLPPIFAAQHVSTSGPVGAPERVSTALTAQVTQSSNASHPPPTPGARAVPPAELLVGPASPVVQGLSFSIGLLPRYFVNGDQLVVLFIKNESRAVLYLKVQTGVRYDIVGPTATSVTAHAWHQDPAYGRNVYDSLYRIPYGASSVLADITHTYSINQPGIYRIRVRVTIANTGTTITSPWFSMRSGRSPGVADKKTA